MELFFRVDAWIGETLEKGRTTLWLQKSRSFLARGWLLQLSSLQTTRRN
jgi:uncharacterized membrane protein YGL010W